MQALKEWAIVCKALEEGRQTVLLRKGGILEYRQGFEVKHNRFMLFPTFEHQAIEHLQTDYAGKLVGILEEQQSGSNVLSSYAEARHVEEVGDITALKALAKYHIWNKSYVNARMAYNPKKPMSVILVRVYKLPNPISIEPKPEWAGCRSWVPINVEATGEPVLDDSAFSKIESEVKELLK